MKDTSGFSLVAVLVFMMAFSIVASTVVPVYQIQVRRELEEELIFRGQEYVRAIQKYRRRFSMYPSSIDALLNTNGIPFLRRQYKNPISDEDFRLLTLSPDGTLRGSSLYREPINIQNGTLRIFEQPSTVGRSSAKPQNFGNEIGFQKETQEMAKTHEGMSVVSVQQSPFSTSVFGQQQVNQQSEEGFMAGNGIVGVAPKEETRSLKVYNNRDKYREWEFIALPGFGTVQNNQSDQSEENLSGKPESANKG